MRARKRTRRTRDETNYARGKQLTEKPTKEEPVDTGKNVNKNSLVSPSTVTTREELCIIRSAPPR